MSLAKISHSQRYNGLKSDVHHCSKFFQSDARAIETLKIESPDQLGWSLSIYNLFERLSWQMALFSLWWTTPSTDLLLTNCNIPPSFYQLYTFRASKSVLLALPRLKVLLMYSLWHEIQGISTKFWHYFTKFDFVLLKEPLTTLKKSRPVVHACHEHIEYGYLICFVSWIFSGASWVDQAIPM